MFNYRLNRDRLTISQLYSNKAILQGAGSLFLPQSNTNVDFISHNCNFISHIVTVYIRFYIHSYDYSSQCDFICVLTLRSMTIFLNVTLYLRNVILYLTNMTLNLKIATLFYTM